MSAAYWIAWAVLSVGNAFVLWRSVRNLKAISRIANYTKVRLDAEGRSSEARAAMEAYLDRLAFSTANPEVLKVVRDLRAANDPH